LSDGGVVRGGEASSGGEALNGTARGIDRLLEIMARLRDPERGCPWDIEQTFETIAPYTIEEAYEVADAIARQDWSELKGELGDLLLQVVYYTQMGRERGWFDFDEVAAAIADKMIVRHPHVFADRSVAGARAQSQAWEDAKAAERSAKAAMQGAIASLLDNVPIGLPAPTRALKLQKRATRIGFDWKELPPIRAKLDEELGELDTEVERDDPQRIEDELGDVLFCVVNYARHLGIDPEAALRRTNAKFEARFRQMERMAGADAATLGLDELELLWRRAKQLER